MHIILNSPLKGLHHKNIILQRNIRTAYKLRSSIFLKGLFARMRKRSHRESISTKQETIAHEEESAHAQSHLQECRRLEGERKIIEFSFLQICIAKIICFGVPLVLSLIGLYCLIKFRSFRSKVFFSSHPSFRPHITSHILANMNDNSSEIRPVVAKKYKEREYFTFTCQLLNYMIVGDQIFPMGSNQREQISLYLSSRDPLSCSLSTSVLIEKLSFFESNEHKVEVPNYFVFIFETLTEPLFMLQYLIFWVWGIQKLYQDIIVNFAFLYIIISVNYVIQYYNYTKIKKMAEKEYSIRTIRNGQYADISSKQIVPGDIYLVGEEIPCDSVLLSGDVLVNEANFTGQNIPILKVRIESVRQLSESSHWLYQGSQLLKSKEGVLAMAIHTGYTSHKGRIIRKIVKHSAKQPEFTHKILIFFVAAYLSAILVYLGYLSKLENSLVRQSVVILVLFQLVSLAVPIGFIGVVTLFPGVSLMKLDFEGIYGQAPYKVYQSAQLKTICFDKTGTLTNNHLQLADIFTYKHNQCTKTSPNEALDQLTRSLFACCHMVKQSSQKLVGDEVDLKMFEHSQAKLLESSSPQVLWEIGWGEQRFQVLRINQFESKHKSMSVLVKNPKSKEVFIFVKGSPQMINNQSINRSQQLAGMISSLSLEGFRTIGFGFNRVPHEEQQRYLSCNRQVFFQNLKMIGLVTFVNELKPEAEKCIERLREEVEVDIKMITGDNIYTAVKTGFNTGLIAPHQTVLLCQGTFSQKLSIKSLQSLGNRQFQQKLVQIDKFDEFVKSFPQDTVLAIEDSFISEDLFDSDIVDKVKVFARVSPQNKTQIVRELKEREEEEYEQRSRWERWFGGERRRVCMVGDGANDLMAIKEADVGISLANSEGTLSADFVVSTLDQIEKIIREGKSISSIVIQSLMILFVSTWLYIPLSLLAMANLCSFSPSTMVYNNLAFIVPLPILASLSKPSDKNSPKVPIINILAPRHQLVMWVNNFIFTVSFICCFQIYWNSSQFQPNQRGWVSLSEGFTTYSDSSTICFLLTFSHCLSIILNLLQKDPWKRSITDNLLLTVWLALNILTIFFIFFHQNWLPFLKLKQINTKLSARVLIVMVAAFGISRAVTSLIHRYCEGLTQTPSLKK